MVKLPKNFLFGSATSAHQIEGGNFNSDWYKWEKEGNTADKSTSEVAADSWNKWQEDIELLKATGQTAYRFSVEWAKIEPKPGEFDNTVIDHYRQILLELRKNKIKSMVTLWHFTSPLWIAQIGGFTNKKTVDYFARYSKKMAEELGDLVDLWATFNEAKVYILKGYIEAQWPPAQKSYLKTIKAWYYMNKAHNHAYFEIKKIRKSFKVGTVLNLTAYQAKNQKSIFDTTLVWLAKLVDSYAFIKPVVKRTDFLGINFYMKIFLGRGKPFQKMIAYEYSDFGWGLNQEGLYQVIVETKKWQKPIYITENGIADREDKYRGKFIEEAFESIGKAISDGADVKGYFHWSLLDNFEWAAGYSMNFGFHTIDRKPRESAFIYKKLIEDAKS